MMNERPPAKLPPRPVAKSQSWIIERNAISLFGDRKTRAILAIYHARRSAKKREFFVHPNIARLWNLSAADLNWALDRLEGKLVETLDSKSGRYRTIRLLPQFEESSTIPGSGSTIANGLHNSFVPRDEERVEIDREGVLARVAAMR